MTNTLPRPQAEALAAAMTAEFRHPFAVYPAGDENYVESVAVHEWRLRRELDELRKEQ